MNFLIVLATLFAFIYNVQAFMQNFEITVTHDGSELVKGKINGKLIARYSTHNFNFGSDMYFSDRQVLKTQLDFNDYVETVELEWDTESSTSLNLKPLIAYYTVFGGMERKIYVPIQKKIYKGQTAIFNKL